MRFSIILSLQLLERKYSSSESGDGRRESLKKWIRKWEGRMMKFFDSIRRFLTAQEWQAGSWSRTDSCLILDPRARLYPDLSESMFAFDAAHRWYGLSPFLNKKFLEWHFNKCISWNTLSVLVFNLAVAIPPFLRRGLGGLDLFLEISYKVKSILMLFICRVMNTSFLFPVFVVELGEECICLINNGVDFRDMHFVYQAFV